MSFGDAGDSWRFGTMKNSSKISNGARKLLIATKNKGKFKEYQIIFKNLPLKLISLKDLNINKEVEEDGKTYEENAVKKAKFYSELTGLPTLGDDGGLEIDFLNGEPGIKSRRWPGYEASDEELIQIILKKIKGVESGKRGAQLVVVIALTFPPEKKSYIFKGVLRGLIEEKPVIKRYEGYPFRSVFYLKEQKKVFGELSEEEEAEISHRKIAINKAMPLIREKMGV
ncbi:MAG: non-canonical purine NTP pyrophosphatase [Patescibacteria group bacterium]